MDAFLELPGATEDGPLLVDEPDTHSPVDASDFLSNSVDHNYPFYEYAACHWGTHLRASGPSPPRELRDAALSMMRRDTDLLPNWADRYRRSSKNWVVLPKKLDPLIIAAFFGLTQLATDILGTNNTESEEQSRAHSLTWAIRLGYADFVKVLLDHGTSLTGASLDNRSPLSKVASRKSGGYTSQYM